MKTVFAAVAVAALTGAAFGQYSADFSIDGVGFTHTTANAPATGPQSVNGPNFTLSYVNTPSTDTTDNFFRTNGGALESGDFGGEHQFESFSIDVSSFSSVDFILDGATDGSSVFNAGSEFFEGFYSLDGGTEVQAFFTTSDGSLNFTETIDTSAASSLVVGFRANINGGGDGFTINSVTVTPTPGAVALAGIAGFASTRRRRA
ncbi:MAG: hypothetical protein AAGD00_07155 [Planctomycetota bacterium]